MGAAPASDLLLLTRAVVRGAGFAAVEDLLHSRRPVPVRLGTATLRVLQDTLSKGVVLALARRGGWRWAGFLHDGRPVAGRLWGRHPAPALHFSPVSARTLLWLLEQPLASGAPGPLAATGPLTVADELLLYLCCDLVAGTPCAPALATQAVFRGSALCWLGFPELLGAERPPDAGELGAARFGALLADRAWALEALQADLTRRWILIERGKSAVASPDSMKALGRAQEAVLEAFLDAVDAAGRRDLAGFLLDAGKALVGAPAARWVEGLSREASLSARAEASRASGAFLRGLGRLARWDAEHRAVRFIDDGYEVAQHLLARWEGFGEAGFLRAQALLGELFSLEQPAPSPDTIVPPPQRESP